MPLQERAERVLQVVLPHEVQEEDSHLGARKKLSAVYEQCDLALLWPDPSTEEWTTSVYKATYPMIISCGTLNQDIYHVIVPDNWAETDT